MATIEQLAVDFSKVMAKLDLQFDSSDGTNHMLREIGRALLEFGRTIAVIEAQTLRTKGSIDLMDRELRGRYTTISDRLSAIEGRLISMDKTLGRILDTVTREIVADRVTVEVQAQPKG